MMNRIYYFTGTGNSLKIARELAAGIGNTEKMGDRKDFRLVGEIQEVLEKLRKIH